MCETGSFVTMGEASGPFSVIADEAFGAGTGCVIGERFFLVDGWFVTLEFSRGREASGCSDTGLVSGSGCWSDIGNSVFFCEERDGVPSFFNSLSLTPGASILLLFSEAGVKVPMFGGSSVFKLCSCGLEVFWKEETGICVCIVAEGSIGGVASIMSG